jgi:hypothetical protein
MIGSTSHAQCDGMEEGKAWLPTLPAVIVLISGQTVCEAGCRLDSLQRSLRANRKVVGSERTFDSAMH